MAAYHREVRQLEDMFNSIKLNHILRHLNEAANALVKAVSSQELVPTGVFTNDQHKPLVRYEGSEQAGYGPPTMGSGADEPSAPFDPKVMELEEDPATEPDPLVDWRMLYLDYLLREALPTDKTETRWLVHRTKSFVLVEGKLYK